MSIAGILGSALFGSASQSVQNKTKDFRQEFQQLGQDLQSGNLQAAQTDFATLQQLSPQLNSTTASQSTSPIAQVLNQLVQDLKVGNTSAAQQDIATLQQDFKNQAAQPAGHHHHHGGGGKQVGQLLDRLVQDLQSGDITGAQQAYSRLQQDLQTFSIGALPSSPVPDSNGISVHA